MIGGLRAVRPLPDEIEVPLGSPGRERRVGHRDTRRRTVHVEEDNGAQDRAEPRGPVQDERALFEALTRGKLAAAGLDVWEDEPTSADNPILNLENVVCSAHMAGVTREATRQAAMQVSGEMLRVLRGERPEVLVNPDVWPRLGRR